MIKKVKKRFVVRKGKKTGIFDNWNECKKLVQGFTNAKYKSFLSKEMAEKAFSGKYEDYVGKDNRILQSELNGTNFFPKIITDGKISQDCIFVDASCSNNPGILERRGVNSNGKEIFRQGPYKDGTINIGEFIALVQGLGYLKKLGKNNTIIYSDSNTAISWIKNKKINTNLKKNEKNKDLFCILEKAIKYLNTNNFENPILKRDTSKWGEIPADFGRK